MLSIPVFTNVTMGHTLETTVQYINGIEILPRDDGGRKLVLVDEMLSGTWFFPNPDLVVSGYFDLDRVFIRTNDGTCVDLRGYVIVFPPETVGLILDRRDVLRLTME